MSQKTFSQIKIIEELNGQEIISQDKDIEIERLQTTCQSLNNRLRILEDRRADNEVLKKRLAESEQIRMTQEQKINQLQEENGTLRSDMKILMEQKTKLQNELENATDYIINMEEKVYKSNKISLELLKQLKDAEIEIQSLQQYIVDLKQRIAVYIPMKDDQVDRKLAEFINNYPERSKLKIMFMRESEGVYQFGTKRVAVKVEKDNIKIRVGGGYLSLDEFLDQYTPVELEKLERKDPLKRFSEKLAIQKTLVN